jgi:hypothetical protein
LLDLDLPVPDGPLPPFPKVALETVYALNDEVVARTVYDEQYFAESLSHKNPEEFVL